jgi:hypothetical protein
MPDLSTPPYKPGVGWGFGGTSSSFGQDFVYRLYFLKETWQVRVNEGSEKLPFELTRGDRNSGAALVAPGVRKLREGRAIR